MEYTQKDAENLLQNEDVIEVGKIIAEKLHCTLYNGNLSALSIALKRELEASQISIIKIIDYLTNNKKVIIDFATSFLKSSLPKSLSLGVSITYTIYLIYLQDNPEELLSYLNRRKIPDSKTVFKELEEVWGNTIK